VSQAPLSILSSAPVLLALRVAGALGRADAAELTRAMRTAPPLAASCMLGLLPRARSALLRQLNAASNGKELVSLPHLARLLWLPSTAAAVAHAHAHGMHVEEGAGLRFRQPGFKAHAEKPLPPLPPAELARWYGDGTGAAAALLRCASGQSW